MTRMMHRLQTIALSVGLALATACAHTAATTAPPAADSAVASAERSAEQNPGAATAGRAAMTVWIATGDAARSDRWIEKTLAADPGEPLALYTRMLIGREALDDRLVVESGLAIIRHHPASPWAELAIARLREVVSLSPALDRLMSEALSGLDTGNLGFGGQAAFRARDLLTLIREGRNDDEGVARARRALGLPSAWTVIGPLQSLRIRDFDKRTPLDDPKHVLAGAYGSVLGGIRPRTFLTPSGVLDLEPDTWRADVFEAYSDVTAGKGGEYLVSARGSNEVIVYLDGVEVLRREPLPFRPPDRSWGRLQLPPGPHRLQVKLGRVDAGWLALGVVRADGAPSDLTFEAARRGVAPPPATATALPMAPARDAEAPDPVERFLTIHLTTLDDSDRARTELARLQTAFPESPTLRALDADLAGTDVDLPRANLVSRVAQDLDAVLKASPKDARVMLGRFQQERNEKRYDEAAARLQQLTEVVGKDNPRILLETARFALDRGDSSRARALAEEALKVDPDRCDALALRADLARRDGEVKRTDELVPRLLNCPGGLGAMTSHLRSRLKTAETIPYLERMLARTPTSAGARRSLAEALRSLGRNEEADAVLEPLKELWPRENDPYKRQAAFRELRGDLEGARGLMSEALTIEGGDLFAARAVALDQHSDVLAWAACDGLAVIDAFQKSSFHPDASAIQVLDLGALEIQPDGSSLERVHSIVQVLDKKGINQFGEVNIPGDAQPLMVRTVKASGKILDAELINGKESISLPNLEPGDFVEFAFVRASGPRPAATPGWQGGQFMFRGEDVPFFESTYLVRAPASVGMEVDTDNLDPKPEIKREGDSITMTYTRRESEAYLREPMPVPDPEVLPWLEAGAGASLEASLTQYADWVPLRTRITPLIREFVRGTESLPPMSRVKAIADRLRTAVKGETSTMDFGDSATTILLRARGNRMLVLKAALAAAGIPSHIVLGRPYSDYPHDFRFPHPASFRSALLRIDVPDQPTVWMDFTLRTAPLNQLPGILSGQEAVLIPNDPGESIQRIPLPVVNAEEDRTDTTMELALDAEGTLTGTIRQTAYGFDAANLRWRLEQVNAAELRQQQERSLSRTFQGLTLTDFAVEDSGIPGDPLVARSVIRVPRFTNRGNGTPTLFANFGPFYLGPRFIRTGERKTPLLVPVDDLNRTHVTLQLAPGQSARLPEAALVDTPFGRYKAEWRQSGDRLTFDEELLMRRNRVKPEEYGAFKAFAAAVDGAQNRQIALAGR